MVTTKKPRKTVSIVMEPETHEALPRAAVSPLYTR